MFLLWPWKDTNNFVLYCCALCRRQQYKKIIQWNTILREKQQVPQLANKFSVFWVNEKLITAFEKAGYLFWNYLKLFYSPTSYFLMIHFNTVLPSTLRSSNLILSFMSQHKNSTCPPPVPHTSARCDTYKEVTMATQQWVLFVLLGKDDWMVAVNNINIFRSSAKRPAYLSDFNQIWNLSTDYNNCLQYQSWKKILLVTAWLIRVDRQTDGHDQVKSRFRLLCEPA